MTDIDRGIEIAHPLKESLKRKTVDIWGRVLDERNPECIYHYTDAAGLYGIINSRALWATNSHFLNDPNETTYPKDVRDSVLSKRCKKSSGIESDLLHHAQQALDHSNSILDPYRYLFYTSFSYEGDRLSQWTRYGDSGRGFAIGFDGVAILTSLKGMATDDEDGIQPTWSILGIHYDVDHQETLVGEMIDLAVEEFENIRTDLTDCLGCEAKARCLAGEFLAQYVSLAVLSFKKSGFAEEEEVRMVPSNSLEMATRKSNFPRCARAAGSSLSTYVEVPLREVKTNRLPIKEIVVGPGANFENAREALTQYLPSMSYEVGTEGGIKIIRSATQIRP